MISWAALPSALERRCNGAREHVAQRKITLALTHSIALAQPFHENDGFAHSSNRLDSGPTSLIRRPRQLFPFFESMPRHLEELELRLPQKEKTGVLADRRVLRATTETRR